MLKSGRELATQGPPLVVRKEEIEVVEQFSPEDQRPGEQPKEGKLIRATVG